MCQQDFDLGLGRTVGKMERRRETRKSHAGSNSLCDANDDAIPRQQNQQNSRYSHLSSCLSSNRPYTSNNNMSSPSSSFGEKNSLEDGSQGRKISGLEHQLSSMEKRERNSSATPSSFKSISDDAAATTDDDSTFTTVAGCLSCNRQRRDDYGGNDFGECLHHQFHQKQEQQKKKICKRQVAMVEAESAFMSPLHTTPFNSTYDAPTGEIDTTVSVASSDCLLQHHHHLTRQHHQHNYQNTTSSVCLSSMSGNTSQDRKTCRQHEQRQQYFFSGLSRAIWIHLGMLSLLSLNLQGKNL